MSSGVDGVDGVAPDGGPQGTAWQLGFTVVLGLAVVGFFVGIGGGGELGREANPLIVHDGDGVGGAADGDGDGDGDEGDSSATALAAMPSYAMIRAQGRGGDSDWREERRRLGEAAALGWGTATESATVGSKRTALADRASNRAYDGAPPTIPHPVRQRAAAECMACHEDGLRLRGKRASTLPHDNYTSCTQCHVVSDAPMPGAMLPPDATFAANSFVGAQEPSKGERAWPIAPPTTPHRTSMRENCMSCHGADGRDPLQTPHPDRQSCTQCHPPSASLDQAPGGIR